MEEIFETLRKQIKGDFDQNNIIIILDNSISLTCKKHPISGTNNSIFIIQPYLIDTIEKIGIQSISMYEQTISNNSSIPKPNTISRPINSSTMDKDVTKPKMLFHKTIHTAKVIRTK